MRKLPIKNQNPNNEPSYSKGLSLSNERQIDMNMKEIENLAWAAKEILRGDYKQSKYGDIILPFVLLRRLERVLESTKEKVLAELEKLKGTDEKIVEARLNQITKQYFHNKSKYNLELLLADPNSIHKNMKSYLRGFSENVRDIFDNFKFDSTVDDLHKQKLLYQIVQHFAKAPLDPKTIDNHMMGTIYEELIRRTSEAANEEAGDHFTPREIIKLMVHLLFAHDKDILKQKHLIRTIYDPAAGTGGMLSVSEEYILQLNPEIEINSYGQELNPESYAICKSDMLLKGLDLNRVKLGNSLTDQDGFANEKFHYMLSNPPFGVDWGKYESKIRDEAEKGNLGKYGPGLPRKSDGSLLFLLQMISKMKPKEQGGSRIAIVLNGSPLFTGEAGSGESNIRKWIIENDMLEAIIALPDQLFYNTGIFTYIWIVTNNKPANRKSKVQLVNAVSFSKKMKSSLGNKRNYIIGDDDKETNQIDEIVKIYDRFKPGQFCKIFDNSDFGYRRITVERPLKRNFQVTEERLEKLKQENVFIKLNEVKPKPKESKQEDVIKVLKSLPAKVYKDYDEFSKILEDGFSHANFKLSSQLQKAIENSLSERDETANPQKDKDENLVPDSELRDQENVPIKQDIEEYFAKEVKPYVPDAWIDNSTRDKIGYEIPFTRHFYVYKPLRPLAEIDAEIRQLQKEISSGLEELM
jgi:type I restriction enzyme M protein